MPQCVVWEHAIVLVFETAFFREIQSRADLSGESLVERQIIAGLAL
jgi:hypothetical protein